MKNINVLGIASSPIKEGNVSFLLKHALAEVSSIPDVKVDFISLAGLNIADCKHCNWCMKKQTTGSFCAVQDDGTAILSKIERCDILVLATPVYFARLSATMASLIDRTRCFIFGNEYPMALRGKIGVALAVAWARNMGIEPTLESLHNAFLIHEMLTPSSHSACVMNGVGAISGQLDESLSVKPNKIGVSDDKQALKATGIIMNKAVTLAREIKQTSQLYCSPLTRRLK